ncbi:hypothetical protein [Chromatium okenii]|jgi:hypothetical protein|uniref:Uncharacterized protein n=1 Tax=Chromatium okenii TaxID=61644 RepID=A0A2S7XSZ1_9GAMM|nr:hypothetical protein [Chromatium okenii]PQJ96859.1 hypothetical protein CXB77_05445 [Chromatium okenii]
MTEEQRRLLQQQLWNIANTFRMVWQLTRVATLNPIQQRLKPQRIDTAILPITKSLIGIIKQSTIDETDYQRYLQDKYL